MAVSTSAPPGAERRRALVVVQVTVMLTVIIGFAALTIDVGTLYRARAELQTAADSAAMAAASTYTTDDMLRVRLGDGDASAMVDVLNGGTTWAHRFSNLNETLGSQTIIEAGDVSFGWIDVTSSTSPINTAVAPDSHNAVRVMVRRAKGGGEGTNGPVQFFFAPIFGILQGESSAAAVAVFDDRVAGYDTAAGGAGSMPFTIHKDEYDGDLVAGGDDYGYDSEVGSVTSGSDGLREINLYPHDLAPGNFGLLNIGSPNQGLPALADQIENGISPDDIESEIGTPVLTFYDGDGLPITYSITGNAGMKTALKSSVEQRIGDVVSFFLHDAVSGTGANSVYQITTVLFGRVMGVKLTGAPAQRGIWLQPVTYSAGGVVLSANAPSSGGMVGRVVLAR